MSGQPPKLALNGAERAVRPGKARHALSLVARRTVQGDRMRLVRISLLLSLLFRALTLFAATVGSVRGVIHDPQHRPLQNVMVMIKAKSSDWSATANSNASGEFA